MPSTELKNNELSMLKHAINNIDEEIIVCSLDGSLIFANKISLRNHKLDTNYTNTTIFDLNISGLTEHTWNNFLSQLRINNGVLRKNVTKTTDKEVKIYYNIKISIDKIDNQETIWFFASNTTKKHYKKTHQGAKLCYGCYS